MRRAFLILTGCLTALVLGLALAYPLLISDLPITKKLDLGVDVVYVYIGNPNLSTNVTGLWRNYSIPNEVAETSGGRFKFDVHAVSYFVVLNITNFSDKLARITNFNLISGPQISLIGNRGVSAGNPILTDSRNNMDIDFISFDATWSAHTSRLIYLSGFVGVHDIAYESLNSGSTYVYATADGQAYSEKASFSGTFLKQIELQKFESNYLYNNLLSDNQMLIFYSGMDVSIGTRS